MQMGCRCFEVVCPVEFRKLHNHPGCHFDFANEKRLQNQLVPAEIKNTGRGVRLR